MPELTSRLGIKKPLGNETVTRASLNENWDIIDAGVAKLSELNFWKPNYSYAFGDIVYSLNAASYKRFECIQAGISGATEPTWPTAGQTITDGTVLWKVVDIKSFLPLSGGTVTGAVNGVTASQFDNSTKLATTAFVKQNAGQFSGTLSINSATTLAAATSAGKHILCFGTGPYNVTLPAANSVPNGSPISFFATTQVNIVIQGTDRIQPNDGAQIPSISLKAGDTLTLDSDGSGLWYPVGGSAQLPYAGVMSGANWPTPPQFDNTTKLATTEFVQRNGLVFKNTNGINISTNTTLTAAQAGCWSQITASGVTVTLPSVSSLPFGGTYTFMAVFPFTLKGSGSDNIQTNGGQINQNAISILAGETITVVANGTTGWYTVCDGFGGGSFSSSFYGNGWQKLPSGLIIQWGAKVANNTSQTQTNDVTFPIAFPNELYRIFTGHIGAASSTTTIVAQTPAPSLSGFSWMSNYIGGNMICNWFAIGR